MEVICKDLCLFLDHFHFKSAIFVAHDWGGQIAWCMALHHPTRVLALAALCTPFIPSNKQVNPLERMLQNPGRFDYQLYFNEDSAITELEQNPRKTISAMIRSTHRDDKVPNVDSSTATVRKRGGLLVGYPETLPLSKLMTKKDLDYYEICFKRTGFRGPLSYYRNIETNWRWMSQVSNPKLEQLTLMITATYDSVLTPESSKIMDKYVPNLTRYELASSHWVQLEKPEEVNEILLNWLNKIVLPKLQKKAKL